MTSRAINFFFIAQYSRAPGVWLSLDGKFVPNNSAVELREVYDTSDDSPAHTLMCVTPNILAVKLYRITLESGCTLMEVQ